MSRRFVPGLGCASFVELGNSCDFRISFNDAMTFHACVEAGTDYLLFDRYPQRRQNALKWNETELSDPCLHKTFSWCQSPFLRRLT